jgi:murein DD-endopeptidase MepM/ murein hydrolase activator NlpD
MLLTADGYDPPVGTQFERQGMICLQHWADWFGQWCDATGFGRDTIPAYLHQAKAYHTGVDFNHACGYGALGLSVHAVAHGVVIAQQHSSVWGNITIIKHLPLYHQQGAILYSRYGHMQNVCVGLGDVVMRGETIGEIGTADGRYIAHLHYDLARTTVFEKNPCDWPGMDIRRLERDYINPKLFIVQHRPNQNL